MGYDDRRKFWFGTASGYMDWFPTPLRGAEMSPQGWESGGTLLNGGGYQLNSFGSHKTYTFEWPESSAPEMAALMKAYSDGTYGRGLIYFVDPLIYQHNIAPAQLADPSLALDFEATSLVYGVTPTSTATSNPRQERLPVRSAVYNLNGVTPGYRGPNDSVFLPIPQGYSMLLGCVYATGANAGVYASWQDSNGVVQTAQRLTPLTTTLSGGILLPDVAVSGEGVWIWVGKTNTANANVRVSAFIARLVKTEWLTNSSLYGDGFYGEVNPYGGPMDPRATALRKGPWVPGLGHSGCRFIGKPTYIANTGVNGGQVSFAASFREVGSWAY